MSRGLPITLTRMENKLCIVVGGGEVAERKVRTLLDADARVRVIAPQLTAGLMDLARLGRIDGCAREYCRGDLDNAFLVIAATDDAAVNQTVADEARGRGCLVNIVDDPAECNFIAPAIIRRGDLTIAISTGGDAPALAKHLREQLEAQFGDEWSAYLDWLVRARTQIAAQYSDAGQRRQAWQHVLNADLREFIAAHSAMEIEERIKQIIVE